MKKFNEWLAVHATLIFGNMWTTYLFFFYGFLPLLIPAWMDKLLYWSNTVQLWSLPLLMVGQKVLSRSDERRDLETHDVVMSSHDEQHEKLDKIIKLLEDNKHAN